MYVYMCRMSAILQHINKKANLVLHAYAREACTWEACTRETCTRETCAGEPFRKALDHARVCRTLICRTRTTLKHIKPLLIARCIYLYTYIHTHAYAHTHTHTHTIVQVGGYHSEEPMSEALKNAGTAANAKRGVKPVARIRSA
jgi:hypothetical protein